ncbi:hypothetical protein EO003_21970 [Escherichia coli]|nr:hypothetical protein [Escherichia coli]EFN6808218.1 hypothetical protein [Escherichia coli]EFN6876256.1 hypothetical protein [Escherichia coli]EFN6885389.1 hypothetical protein [Escherichia coli]
MLNDKKFNVKEALLHDYIDASYHTQTLTSIINHQSSIINHQSSIINHQSSIINHQSSIINHQSSRIVL